MARTRTIALLRRDAYLRADLENATSLITTADATEYINKGYAALYRLLARAGRHVYYPTESTMTLTAATSSYPLTAFTPSAATFWLEVQVIATIDGRKYTLEEYDFSELAMLSDSANGWSGSAFKYKIVGERFYVYPAPASTYSISLWWIPAPARFSTDGSDDTEEIDGVADYEQFLIDFAAREMAVRRKNWELKAILDAELGQKAAEIEVMGASRRAAPPVVADVRPWAKPGNRWPLRRMR
jgi:hypothetical protein